MAFKSIYPGKTEIKDFHENMLGMVAPRPIAFASTLSENGVANLAPYSFYNAFSSNPPILVFSSNRRVSDNSTKDTLSNVSSMREVVINAVSYDIVRQMALASVDYPAGVSEFEKTGLTPLKSEKVKPWRVAESPAQMECVVKDIIPLGQGGGAGHLVICEIVVMHVREDVLDAEGKIDPHKIDLMGRMGRAFYVRASGAAIHKIYQPFHIIGIGVDRLPQAVRMSHILTGNDLAQLGAIPHWPSDSEIANAMEMPEVKEILSRASGDTLAAREEFHQLAKSLIASERPSVAFAVLLIS